MFHLIIGYHPFTDHWSDFQWGHPHLLGDPTFFAGLRLSLRGLDLVVKGGKKSGVMIFESGKLPPKSQLQRDQTLPETRPHWRSTWKWMGPEKTIDSFLGWPNTPGKSMLVLGSVVKWVFRKNLTWFCIWDDVTHSMVIVSFYLKTGYIGEDWCDFAVFFKGRLS